MLLIFTSHFLHDFRRKNWDLLSQGSQFLNFHPAKAYTCVQYFARNRNISENGTTATKLEICISLAGSGPD